ncbi:MAG TPA: 6-carboxytetrahydropterin synthase [Gemmatimonadales bacterium]|nr:6-carboxytetrahydropterin synthase [Gemmatimonadales bacterium]
MPASLTRTVGFRATHRFYKPEWSDELNRSRFGWTTDAPGHAHDYTCAVTVSGLPDAETGLIVDLAALDRVLADVVVTPLHDKHINLDVPEFAYGKRLPSCEALAQYLFERIAAGLPPGAALVRVRVAEDATLHAEYSR